MPSVELRGVELDHERQGPGRTPIQRHDVTVIRGHDVTVIRGHDVTVIRGHDVTVIRGHDVTVNRGHDVTVNRGHDVTMIWGHGLTSSRAEEAVPPVLVDWSEATRHLDVVRYDARGHGRSGFTPDPSDYGWDRMALDQLALADHLGIDRYVAGGASMGCATALHVAVAAPERVEALVLAIPPTAWETRAAQADNYRRMGDIIETRGVEPVIAAGAELPIPDPFVQWEGWKARSAARMRAADPVRLAGLFRGAATADLPDRDAVAAIEVPALILAWTGDPSHPVITARELDRLLPEATLHEASTLAEFETWTGRLVDFLTPP